MAWLAVDKEGDECIYENRPHREDVYWDVDDYEEKFVELPKGSIEKLLGRELTWEDEAVEI